MPEEAELWYARAHFKLGEAYRTRGSWEKARSEYQKAVRISPKYYEAYNAIGETYLAERQIEQALEFVERAALIRSDDPVVRMNLGRAFLGAGKYAEAAAEFALALSKAPDNPEIHYFTGKMCLERGEYQKAIVHLRKALASKNFRLDAQVSIGLARTALGSFDKATATLKEVLREDPGNVAALDCITTAYRRRGMGYEALKYHRRACSIKAETSVLEGAASSPLMGGERRATESVPIASAASPASTASFEPLPPSISPTAPGK